MDFLVLLQTIGICVGSLALVAIAFMLFINVTSLTVPDMDDDYNIPGINPTDLSRILNTPSVNKRKKSTRKTSKSSDEK